MPFRVRPAVSLITSGLFLTFAPQAFSQEVLALEEVVVTAQKREQSLQDVPVSVQALSGTMLENAGVRRFEDLVNISPSLQLQDNLSPFQKSVYVRGVGTTINSVTVEPSVSTVLDGVVLARQGSFFSDLADIERVEVLRGPQSTLFGKNASAGVLSIVTQRPNTEESEGSVELGYDEYGESRLKGTYSGPINEDVAFRIGANYHHVDENHIENIAPGGPSMDGAEAWGVRGKLSWAASDDVDALFIVDYTKTDAPAGARVGRWYAPEIQAVLDAQAGEGNRDAEFNDPNENDITDWGVSAEVNWSLENHTVTSITAYRVWDIDDQIDIDSSAVNPPLSSYLGVGTPSFRGFVDNTKDTDQWSQEFRVQSEHDGDLQYVVGAFLWGTSYESNGTERRTACFDLIQLRPLLSSCDGELPPGTILGNQSYNQLTSTDTEYYAVFGQADYLLNDSWTLTLGLRYQYDNLEWDIEQLGAIVDGDREEERYEGAGDESYTEWTGKAAVQYVINDESNSYFSYSRGYKGPGLSAGSEFNGLDPEFVDAFELGYKARLLDGRLSLNTALFWQEFEDTQVNYFSTEDVAFRPTNAGETRQRGVEFDSQYAASNNLIVNASVTWLDAEYLDYEVACYTMDPDPQCQDDGAKDVAGEVTTFSPEWKAIIGGRYTQQLMSTDLDWFVQANYRWQSEVQYDASQNPMTEQDAYGVADLSFGIDEQAGKYTATFFIYNLFDENYVNNIAAFVNTTGMSDNVIQFVPKSADRYVGATFKYNF